MCGFGQNAAEEAITNGWITRFATDLKDEKPLLVAKTIAKQHFKALKAYHDLIESERASHKSQTEAKDAMIKSLEAKLAKLTPESQRLKSASV